MTKGTNNKKASKKKPLKTMKEKKQAKKEKKEGKNLKVLMNRLMCILRVIFCPEDGKSTILFLVPSPENDGPGIFTS
jgi:hypothetical protein